VTVLGSLPYLNVKPLIYPFENGQLPMGWSLKYAPPASLAEMLHNGEIAAAPVSSFEVLRSRDLVAVPGVCISSRAAVKSVVLLSRVPFEKIHTVALDSGSLTGAAMVRILLAETFDLSPIYKNTDPDIRIMLHESDAALLIGNAALEFRPVGLRVMDIGQGWKDLTGLPAVFALWAGREDLLTAEIAAILIAARDAGLEKIEHIADIESPKLGLTRSACREYLEQIINYRLGKDELASLEKFAALCKKHNLTLGATEGHVRFCNVG